MNSYYQQVFENILIDERAHPNDSGKRGRYKKNLDIGIGRKGPSTISERDKSEQAKAARECVQHAQKDNLQQTVTVKDKMMGCAEVISKQITQKVDQLGVYVLDANDTLTPYEFKALAQFYNLDEIPISFFDENGKIIAPKNIPEDKLPFDPRFVGHPYFKVIKHSQGKSEDNKPARIIYIKFYKKFGKYKNKYVVRKFITSHKNDLGEIIDRLQSQNG